MKRKPALTILSLFMLTGHALGQNVIINGSFEEGAEGWNVDGSVLVTDADARVGDFSAYLGPWGGLRQTCDPIPAPRLVQASFWLRHESLDLPPDGSFAYYSLWVETKTGEPLLGAVPLRPYTLEWQQYGCWNLAHHPDCVVRGIAIGGIHCYVDDVKLVVDGLQVGVDVKPRSDIGRLNLHGRGVVPVAVLGSEEFDVHDIDPATLAFEGASAKPKGQSGKIGGFADVNGDSVLDLVVRFPVDELALAPGTKVVELTGRLTDGREFFGTDAIELVGGAHDGAAANTGQYDVVPEPISLALLALGGLALIRRRRK